MTKVKDLADLGSAYAESLVPRPKLADISGLETTDENAVVRTTREMAIKTRAWASVNLAVVAEHATKPREIQERNEPRISAFMEDYKGTMEDETPSYRRACWIGTFDQCLSVLADSRARARQVIDDLVREGLLEESKSGLFAIYDKRYSVPERSTFAKPAQDIPGLLKEKLIEQSPWGVIIRTISEDPEKVVRYRPVQPPEKNGEPRNNLPELADEEPGEEKVSEEQRLPEAIRENYELARLLENFLRRTSLTEREARTKAAEALYAQAELSLNDFLAGKTGSITFGVPPEQVFKEDGSTPATREDGSEIWRGGGTLLVRNDGQGNVWPVSASGNIQRGVDPAVAMKKVYVPHDRLEQKSLGYIEGLSREENGKAVLIWNLLRRGIAAAKKEQEIRDQKTKLAAGVDLISMADFLLEGKSGFCLIESERPWEPHVTNGDKPVYISPFYFLAERFVQGEGDDARSFIRVVKAPQNIEIYLAPCSGEYPDSEKFSSCPQPLQAVLRAIYGQTANNARLAEKYNRTI
jgi:hypothetical protein